jgi:hypothetical protein
LRHDARGGDSRLELVAAGVQQIQGSFRRKVFVHEAPGRFDPHSARVGILILPSNISKLKAKKKKTAGRPGLTNGKARLGDAAISPDNPGA